MQGTESTLSFSHDWSMESIRAYHCAIDDIARKTFRLDVYPIQIEIINAQQMIDRYYSNGLPVDYTDHWSRGKQFVQQDDAYRKGHMGLAYEIVINTNPCIAYLMGENTLTMQALVIAHAAYGHNSFFKNNYLFREWTDAEGIVDYLVYARGFIKECESKYGVPRVERLLDACHALAPHGVDHYKRPRERTAREHARLREERSRHRQQYIDDLWHKVVPASKKSAIEHDAHDRRVILESEENLLRLCEERAPFLEPWEREVIRIVRQVAQYFHPQRQTHVMNEGWATFWHYTILQQMYTDNIVGNAFMEEFLQYHTAVIRQLRYDHPAYRGINPYSLGYTIFTDIRRICEGGMWFGGAFREDTPEQRAEDAAWFPTIAGKPWREVLEDAMRNYRDESFIQQFLSPKVMRDMGLFSTLDIPKRDYVTISAIHNADGYLRVRETLAEQYLHTRYQPNIQAVSVDERGDRTLRLMYTPYQDAALDEQTARRCVRYMAYLWGCPVELVKKAERHAFSILERVQPTEER